MGKDFTVTINHPLRRLEWLEMFGTTCLHIKSITPELTIIPGFDELQQVYYIDLDLLQPHQYRRLIRHIATKFNLPIKQVMEGLKEQGFPVLAADCILTIHNPHKWL